MSSSPYKNEDLPVFSYRLREARLRLGISQAKLGTLAGVDEFSASARMNQYEKGKHYPDYKTAERLAKVLGVPTPYLFAREDALADWILKFGVLKDES